MRVLELEYQKLTDFDDYVFVCQKDSESFNVIKDLYETLSKTVDTYIPMYYSDKYDNCRITFKKPDGKKQVYQKGAIYKVGFKILKMNRNSEDYINCYIQSIKKLKSAVDNDACEEI